MIRSTALLCQIITEMLPVSSSGHMRLLHQWYKERYNPLPEHQNASFEHFYYLLHLPTALVVTGFFAHVWWGWFMDGHSSIIPIFWMILADGIPCFFFLVKNNALKKFPLWIGFLITVIALLSTAVVVPKVPFGWQLPLACMVGCAQAIAFLPGISRLGLTTAVAHWYGLELFQAFALSWLIHVPLIGVAAIHGIYHVGMKPIQKYCHSQKGTLFLATLISALVLGVVVAIINLSLFWLFGLYMLIPLGCALWYR